MLEKIKRGVDPYADADGTREALIRLSRTPIPFTLAAGGTVELLAPRDGYVNALFITPQADVAADGVQASVAVKGGAAVVTAAVPNPTTKGSAVTAAIAGNPNTIRLNRGERITVTAAGGTALSGFVDFQADV